MKPLRSLNILGETIEILVDGSMTAGTSATIVQFTHPGGGPPLHSHTREDETFTVLDGDFEIFADGEWHKAPIGEIFFAPRGSVHTFRNVGRETGRMAVFIAPAGLEQFFERLADLVPSGDMQRIQEIFTEYGLSLHPH